MSVIDRLITAYELDDRGYAAGAKRVVASTRETHTALAGQQKVMGAFGSAIDNVGKSMGQASSMFSSAFAPIAAGVGIMGGLVAAQASVGWSALQAAADFGRMEATFAGALGSMDAGKETMAALEEYALKSAYSLEALASAATMLAVGGLNIQRILPLVERFGLAVGGLNPEALEQVAGAFIRIKGGSFGEAMEIFRRAGISAQDLRNQGIAVNKGGEILATSEELISGLEQLSEVKLKRVVDEIMKSDAVSISNLFDALGKAQRAFGFAIAEEWVPKIKEASDALNKLSKEGVVGEVAKSFTDLLSNLTGEVSVEGQIKGLAATLVAGNKMMEAAFKGLYEGAMEIAYHFAFPLSSWFSKKEDHQGWRDMMGGPEDPFQTTYDSVMQDFETERKLRELKDKKAGKGANGKPQLPGEQDPSDAISSQGQDSIKSLRAIEKNTRELADQQRFILGGNDIGRLGVTPEEKSRMRRGSRSERGGGGIIGFGLEMTIGDLIDQRIYQMKRAGQL